MLPHEMWGSKPPEPEVAPAPLESRLAPPPVPHQNGERGRHARSAVGAYALPFGIALEVEMVVELE